MQQHETPRQANLTLFTEEQLEESTAPIKLIIVDPVSHLGLLKTTTFEDVAYYRLKFNVDLVFPSEIFICGRLIESDELYSYACVTTNRNTLGFAIKDQMNVFESSVQLELQLSSLNCKSLSDDYQLLKLNLCEELSPNHEQLPSFLKQTNCISFTVNTRGYLHAVAIWFEYRTQNGRLLLSTSTPQFNFNQSAFVLNGEEVQCGSHVDLLVGLNKSEIFAELSK